jgi:S-sulfo-L-cysteine synthase (3-phospho-L-serine-dependent)
MNYLFVESNTTGTGGLAVQRALVQGHHVTFATRDPSLYPFLRAGHPELDVQVIETNDMNTLVGAVTNLQKRARLDGIVTFSTFYVSIAAALAEQLGLPTLNAVTARTCHEKPALRRVLRDAGLPCPPFWIVDSPASAATAAGAVTFPCVIKPVADSGSVGVKLVHDADELRSHCDTISAITVNARQQRQAGHALVEELLSGPEFSVETMTMARGDTRVVGVTKKHLSVPPYFVEIGHDFPANLPIETTRVIERAAVAALEAVGYDFGPAHTEIRLTPIGPVVVEVNPRLAGGMIPELVRLASGIDLLQAVLDGAAGQGMHLDADREHAASIRFITSGSSGRLRTPPSLASARSVPGVCAVQCDRGVGAPIRLPTNASDRLGYAIACGSDRVAVAAAADAAVRRIVLDIEPSTAVEIPGHLNS